MRRGAFENRCAVGGSYSVYTKGSDKGRARTRAVSPIYWPLEPDDDVITQAYFDAKCAGDDGDWADLAYDNLYY